MLSKSCWRKTEPLSSYCNYRSPSDGFYVEISNDIKLSKNAGNEKEIVEPEVQISNETEQPKNNKIKQITEISTAINIAGSIIGPFVPMIFFGLFLWISFFNFIVVEYSILLGLPFYWIISSEEIKAFFKHKIRQFKVKFGYF